MPRVIKKNNKHHTYNTLLLYSHRVPTVNDVLNTFPARMYIAAQPSRGKSSDRHCPDQCLSKLAEKIAAWR